MGFSIRTFPAFSGFRIHQVIKLSSEFIFRSCYIDHPALTDGISDKLSLFDIQNDRIAGNAGFLTVFFGCYDCWHGN